MLALLACACGDLALPFDRTLGDANLLFLPLQAAATGVPLVSIYVNSRPTTATLRHTDQFNTVFAQVTFPAGSIAANGGAVVSASDSVRITISSSASAYRITITPDEIDFTGAVVLTFSAAIFGDFSVAGGATRFVTPEGYLADLAIWEEISPGQWRAVPSSVDAVRTTVRATLSGGGTFALAAER